MDVDFFKCVTCPCACVLSQSCLTLCRPMDCSPPGSSVHYILLKFLPIFNWVFFLLSCTSSLYVLNINPVLDILFANIFSYSLGCLFISLVVSFAVQNIFSFICLFLKFCSLCFRCHIELYIINE